MSNRKLIWEKSLRSFKLWWSISPNLLLSIFLSTLMESLRPLVPLYLTAQLVDELAFNRDIARIRYWILLLVGMTFLTNLLASLFSRWRQAEESLIGDYLEGLYSEKFIDMDFESIDSVRVQHLRSQIRQNDNWSSWGMRQTIMVMKDGLQAIFTILASLVLSFQLFVIPLADIKDEYMILNSWWFNILFIIIVVFLTILAPILNNKANGYWARASEGAKMGNRVFSFFGFKMFYELERATDMRIYRQDLISLDKFNEGNAFGLKGEIAKYARGPMGLLKASSQALRSILMGIIFLYVGIKAWSGAFGPGQITQYIGALLALSNGLSLLIASIGNMIYNADFLDTSYEFLDIENKMHQGKLTVEKGLARNYEIEIKNLSFKYPGREEWAIKDLSMKFNLGERLAIVGPNGSGKTTLIKLLCRLYDPSEGEILLNGINIKMYDYKEYISMFSVVFQDFKLFALPLGENIGVSRSYKKERVYQVLEEVGLQLDKGNFPKGLSTYLYKNICEKGVEVSGGEAQKIAIARALYNDSPFLILDEPTASLDPMAEAEIYERLNEIVGKRTAIFISHRLSSCRFADRIVVLDQGKIIESGSHDLLVEKKKGLYYDLWMAQAQYYQ